MRPGPASVPLRCWPCLDSTQSDSCERQLGLIGVIRVIRVITVVRVIRVVRVNGVIRVVRVSRGY